MITFLHFSNILPFGSDNTIQGVVKCKDNMKYIVIMKKEGKCFNNIQTLHFH